MIMNNPFRTFTQTDTTNYTAQQIAKRYETARLREKAGLDSETDECSFAAKLKQADEFLASGKSCGATDTVAIILRQMDDPTPGNPVTKEVFHKGVRVVVTRDALYGNSITIGGSSNPDWIHVSTSVGTVHIDLNDTTSLMKCLDMFSPEDVTAIMAKITEVKQAREALRQIDEMRNKMIEGEEEKEDGSADGEGAKTIGEAVGVVGAQEAEAKEEEKKSFV